MKFLKRHKCLAKLTVTAVVLMSMTLQVAAQQADRDRHEPRHQRPGDQSNNIDVQVWVGVDVLPDGIPLQGSSTNLPAFSVQQRESAQFAGAWSSQALPGLVLTLKSGGDFSLATPVNPDRLCTAGVERGSWIAYADTNELQFHIKTDTSGRCGFSDLDSTMTVITTEVGLTLIANDPATGEQVIPLMRAEP
jgi:hypothetical protein